MTTEETIPPQASEQTETQLDAEPSTGGSLMLPEQQIERSLSPFNDFMQKAIALKKQGLDLRELVESYEKVATIEERRKQAELEREEFVKDKKHDRLWKSTFNGFKILMGVAAFSTGFYLTKTDLSSIFGAFLMGGGLIAAGISFKEVVEIMTRLNQK